MVRKQPLPISALLTLAKYYSTVHSPLHSPVHTHLSLGRLGLRLSCRLGLLGVSACLGRLGLGGSRVTRCLGLRCRLGLLSTLGLCSSLGLRSSLLAFGLIHGAALRRTPLRGRLCRLCFLGSALLCGTLLRRLESLGFLGLGGGIGQRLVQRVRVLGQRCLRLLQLRSRFFLLAIGLESLSLFLRDLEIALLLGELQLELTNLFLGLCGGKPRLGSLERVTSGRCLRSNDCWRSCDTGHSRRLRHHEVVREHSSECERTHGRRCRAGRRRWAQVGTWRLHCYMIVGVSPIFVLRYVRDFLLLDSFVWGYDVFIISSGVCAASAT